MIQFCTHATETQQQQDLVFALWTVINQSKTFFYLKSVETFVVEYGPLGTFASSTGCRWLPFDQCLHMVQEYSRLYGSKCQCQRSDYRSIKTAAIMLVLIIAFQCTSGNGEGTLKSCHFPCQIVYAVRLDIRKIGNNGDNESIYIKLTKVMAQLLHYF